MLGQRTQCEPFDNNFIVKADDAEHVQRLFFCGQLGEKLRVVSFP